MTDDDKALVERLRERGPNGGLFCDCGDKAADRIEALSAKVERLREALVRVTHYGDRAAVEVARAALGEQQ